MALHHRRHCTGLPGGDHRRPDPVSTSGWRLAGGPVLEPEVLHPGLHHRARLHGEDQARVRPAEREDHRHLGRLDRRRRGVGAATSRRRRARLRTTRSSATHDFKVAKLYGMLPASGTGDPKSERSWTTRCAECLRHRPGEEDQADPRLPDDDRPELRRGAAGHRLAAAHREPLVATPVNWQQGEDVIIAGSVSDDEAKETYRELGISEAVHPDRPAAGRGARQGLWTRDGGGLGRPRANPRRARR